MSYIVTLLLISQMFYKLISQILISPSHIFTTPAHFFPKIKFTFSLSLLGHIFHYSRLLFSLLLHFISPKIDLHFILFHFHTNPKNQNQNPLKSEEERCCVSRVGDVRMVVISTGLIRHHQSQPDQPIRC